MSESKGQFKVFIAAVFVILTGLFALRILLSSRGAAPAPRPAAAPAEPTLQRSHGSVFDDTRDAERIQAELASRDLGFKKPDKETTLPDLKVPESPAPTEKSLTPQTPLPQPLKAYEEPAPVPGALTEQEKALLEGAGGPKTPEDAAKIGASYDLLARLMVQLGNYPRLAGYVLNNDWVVKGFMSRPTSRGTCSDPGKLKKFLMDTSDPRGISRSLPLVQQIAHASKEMPSVMATSKLVTEILECPSFNGLLNDTASVKEVALANPTIFVAMTDPDVMQAIMKSPPAFNAFKKAQAGAGL